MQSLSGRPDSERNDVDSIRSTNKTRTWGAYSKAPSPRIQGGSRSRIETRSVVRRQRLHHPKVSMPVGVNFGVNLDISRKNIRERGARQCSTRLTIPSEAWPRGSRGCRGTAALLKRIRVPLCNDRPVRVRLTDVRTKALFANSSRTFGEIIET